MWRYVRWLPAVVALLLVVIGGVELVVLLGLIGVQLLVLGVPFLARHVGRAIGQRRAG